MYLYNYDDDEVDVLSAYILERRREGLKENKMMLGDRDRDGTHSEAI